MSVCVCIVHFIIGHQLHMCNSSYDTLMMINKLIGSTGVTFNHPTVRK